MAYTLTENFADGFGKSIEFARGFAPIWDAYQEKFFEEVLHGKMNYPPALIAGFRYPKPDFVPEIDCEYSASEFHVIMPSAAGMAINQAVIDIIEDIEPGVHQYFPVKFILQNGEQQPEPYFLLNNCSRIKALDLENSAVIVKHLREDRHPFRPYNLYRISENKSVVYSEKYRGFAPPHAINVIAEKVVGRAVWAEYGYSLLFGEEFVKRVLGIGGFGAYRLDKRIGEI